MTRTISILVLVAMIVGAPVAHAQDSKKLEDAYKREFAFLEAEKRALKKRIEDEKAAAKKRIAAAKAEIAALQGSVVATANQAENVSELMLAAERDIDGLDESSDIVGDIVVRAETAYAKTSVKLPAADPEKRDEVLAQLRFAFETAPAELARLATVRTESGAFFDGSGKQVEGQIVRVGGIAAYGIADSASGVLAPAGEGRLKLWSADRGAAAARALAAGKALSELPIFLFESLDKGVEEKKGKSIREFINTGGVIGWVIVCLGLMVFVMIVVRLTLILWATKGSKRFLPEVFAHLDKGDLDKAIETAKGAQNATGRVVLATLENLDKSRPALEDIVAEAVLAEQPRLSRFGASILIVAAVSPLLGLLGTVTGMISTFDIITEFGTGNPKLLSGGISEALVTTELGLMVAIPSLLVGHMLSGLAERARDDLDGATLATVNRANGIRLEDEELPQAEAIAQPS